MHLSKYSLLKVPFFDIKSSVHKFLILPDSFHSLSICNPHLLLTRTDRQYSLGLSLKRKPTEKALDFYAAVEGENVTG